METTPLILGSVLIDGGLSDGETVQRATVTMNGDVAKLSHYEPSKARSVELDRLTDMKADEKMNGIIVVTGVSQQLLHEVGLPPYEARVTWTITPAGCSTC